MSLLHPEKIDLGNTFGEARCNQWAASELDAFRDGGGLAGLAERGLFIPHRELTPQTPGDTEGFPGTATGLGGQLAVAGTEMTQQPAVPPAPAITTEASQA